MLKPGQHHPEIAEAIVDDVFATIGEVLSARDSSSKEFHSAVLRALSKEPLMVAEAETGQAPGTGDEVESCLNSSVSLLPCSAFTRPTTNALGDLGTPACCLLLFLGPQSATFCFTSLPTVWSPAWLLIITLLPTPFLWCHVQRHPSCGRSGYLSAVWLDEELSWEDVESLRKPL